MGRQREPRDSGHDPRHPGGRRHPARERADKVCRSCGRRIEWRAAWARNWDDVAHCSDACRARKVRPVDRELEESIRSLLGERTATATICPSEAARAVAAQRGDAGDDGWRALMEPARRAARRLVAGGEVEITQGGRVVDPSTAKGPVRIRRAR
ncbi:hypothetical protein GCM10009792_23760 [Microcella alkalica]|uniref:DUF2256 and DUF3253 domain-containing protein n=1 Tax=Microcella alkalica TaxID=355930 RepID=A0A839E7F0_9MICO|nr:DUF3253 domain-containing protein [Microcella alkalica]MBA8848431.1 hypothetical protein [Microcella alkalica]